MTQFRLYAIGTSTTLESNKSQSHNAQAAGHAFSMRTGSVQTAVSPLQAAEVSKDGTTDMTRLACCHSPTCLCPHATAAGRL
jgi:hypothetical protein